MVRLIGKIPRQEFAVACSGGKDSMMIVDFLRRYPKNKFKLLYFNHGTEHGNEAEDFMVSFSKKTNIQLCVGRVSREKHKEESKEEFWRNERYSFFSNYEIPIITCHHLQDQIETWLFSSFNGNPRLINYRNKNVIRPFLRTSRECIDNWVEKNSVEFIEDPSNSSCDYMRNLIRHKIYPEVLKVNPGISKVILKKMSSWSDVL